VRRRYLQERGYNASVFDMLPVLAYIRTWPWQHDARLKSALGAAELPKIHENLKDGMLLIVTLQSAVRLNRVAIWQRYRSSDRRR